MPPETISLFYSASRSSSPQSIRSPSSLNSGAAHVEMPVLQPTAKMVGKVTDARHPKPDVVLMADSMAQ